MFTLLRLAFQVLLKKHSLAEKGGMKKFLLDLLAIVKPLAVSSETKIDDKLIENLEFILTNEELYDYFYNLIRDQFSTDDVIFESVNDELVVGAMNTQASLENLPQGVNPATVLAMISHLISIINWIKSVQD